MIITNSIKDYTKEEINQFGETIKEMEEYMKQTLSIFAKESKKMTDPSDNVAYINPSIKIDFEKTKSSFLLLHNAIEKYRDWHEEMLLLASKNIGQYHIISVQQHVDEIINICRGFYSFIKTIK